jgi:glucokinase
VTSSARPSSGIAFGIDIGGTKVLGVALDDGGQIVAEARVPTPTERPNGHEVGADVAEAVAAVVALLDDEVHAPNAPVGVGAPGMLDRNGVLRYAPNLPVAAGIDWRRLIGRVVPGRTVLIENDANFAALAEHRFGAGRGADHLVVVTLGTGIGGGIVIDGKILTGAYGFAGEIGHQVVDPSGPRCPCGRRGCWERYASGGGLGRLAREAALAGTLGTVVHLAGGDPEAVKGEHVTRAAVTGDAGALEVMEQLGWWVALGLTNLSAMVDPERIVLGGGLVQAGELLLAPTRRAYADLVEGGGSRPEIQIVAAQMGERAGAIGAAAAARDGILG